MAINVGSVAVSVVPDASRFNALLKEKLRDLTATIRVDVDTAGVTAKLDEVKAKVDMLGAKSPSIRVDVDSAGAVAQLAAVGAEADRTADKNDKLGNSASGAGGGMSGLIAAAIGLSPALVAVGASAIGAAAALGTMAAAGGVGLGVMTIALSSVTGAVKLLGQQQTAQAAASQAAATGAAAHAQAIASASRQIQSAQQGVASAQYGLIQADQQEQSALQALQSAREAATRQLTSMANAAVDSKLAERQAVLDLQTATANYRTTMANAGATEQQRQQAALDLAKAQQHLTESHQAATNAQIDNTKAQKAGVNGAPQVVSAVQAVANAHHQQEQAAQALKNAQQGVTVAIAAMAAAQHNAAGSTSASLSAINAKVAALDPTVRAFAEYLRGTWAPIWKQVQSASAGGLLPGLRDGMDAMKSSMPGLISFIKDISSRLGDMARNVGAAFNSPFWQSFFAFLQRTMGPVLSSLGKILGNIATGFAGLWMAFEPIIMPITKGIESLTGKFADFGKQAAGSEGFGKFIAFIRATGPVIMKILGDLWQIIVHIVEALAPLAGPMLAGLSTLTGILRKIPVPVLTATAVALGAIYSGMKLVQGVSALAALGPWGLAAAAVAGVFLLVYTNSKTFRDFIATQVIPTLKAWGDWLLTHVVPALADLWDWITHKLVPVLAGIFMKAWDGITWAVKTVSKAFSDNKGEMKQVWDMFSAYVGFIVRYVLPLLGSELKLAFQIVGGAISAVIQIVATLIDAWDAMWQKGKDLGHWFSHDFVGFFQGAWTAIENGWDRLGKNIGRLWNNLKHYLMDPVAWVVDVVINKGLIGAWDWVVDKLHLPGGWHAKPMGVPAVPPLMATGGVLPGYAPGQDTVHAILSPGEGVLVPEAVRALGGGPGINAINSQFSSRVAGPGIKGGHQAFGGGGLASSIWGFLTSLNPVGAVVGGAALSGNKDAQRLEAMQRDPLGWIKSIASSAMGGLSKAAPMAGLLGDMIGRLAGGVGDAILGALGGGSRGGGTPAPAGASVERWRSTVDAVLTLLGQPTSYDNGVLAMIQAESGGNPNAINRTDSNAMAGHPSQGLMQTIPSTFAAYAGPYVSRGITDGFANIFAGVNYALHRYGPGILASGGRHSAPGHYIGYDAGGTLDPGYHMVYNGTGMPEIVAPRHTFEQIMSGASGGTARTAPLIGELHTHYETDTDLLVRQLAFRERSGAFT